MDTYFFVLQAKALVRIGGQTHECLYCDEQSLNRGRVWWECPSTKAIRLQCPDLIARALTTDEPVRTNDTLWSFRGGLFGGFSWRIFGPWRFRLKTRSLPAVG